MQSRIKLNVFSLVKKLEMQKGESYTVTAIADKADLSRLTVNSLMQSDTNRIDLITIEKLIDFFESEGMPIDIGDLFTVPPKPVTLLN